jgi:threonyl-tRNA synthetase
MPGWLSPVQVELIPVSDGDRAAAMSLVEELAAAGLRPGIDEGVGSLAKRIRLAHKQRPFAKMIVGAEEAASGVYRLQLRDSEEKLEKARVIERLRELCRRPLD